MAQTQFNAWQPQLDPVNGLQAQEPRVFTHDAVGVVVGAINNSDANHGITMTAPGRKYEAGDTITLSNPNSVVTGLLASITTPFVAATDGTYLCSAEGGSSVDNVVTTGTGTGLTFNLVISGGVTTEINILTAGSGYVMGDEITLEQARFGGAVDEVIELDADNFLEAIVTIQDTTGIDVNKVSSLNHSLIPSMTRAFTGATDDVYDDLEPGVSAGVTTTSVAGSGLKINLTVVLGIATILNVASVGTGYVDGDTIVFSTVEFGGATNMVITIGAGEVSEYEVTTVGAGYFIGDSLTVVGTTSVDGSGFTCDVSNIDIPNTQKRGCCLYVGASAGLTSLTAVMESGNTATFKTISAGTILPFLVKRITTTLDTNDVIALY